MHPHVVNIYKQLAGYAEGDELTCEEEWIKYAIKYGIDLEEEKKKDIENSKYFIARSKKYPDNESCANSFLVRGQQAIFRSNLSLEEIGFKTPEEYDTFLERCEMLESRLRERIKIGDK